MPDWLDSLLPVVAAVAAIIAALVSGRYARASKQAEIDAQTIKDLEDRLNDRRFDTYKPMIDMWSQALTKGGVDDLDPADIQALLRDFSAWISIFGSDDAVRTFHNFMQSSYNDPPAEILVRLYAEFVLAARRDMGHRNTEIGPSVILGMRITDYYRSESTSNRDLSFDDLCAVHGWEPPWLP